MPKRFNNNEKEYIIKRLKEEALKCLMTFGIKKTSVDELVKRVNIPKGTFYLFYESKEVLFFDVINDLHENVQKKLMQEMAEMASRLTVDSITEFMMRIYQEVNNTGLLTVMMSGELELLMRKLPEDKVKEHMVQDNLSMEQFFAFLPLKGNKNIDAFSAAFRGIFMTMLYKREIGEMVFDEVMRLMLRGLIIQMMEEEKND